MTVSRYSRLNRRQFFAAGAAAGLAATQAGAAPAGRPRAAVIGRGPGGQQVAAQLRKPDAPLELVAVAHRSSTRDWTAMLEHPGIDAVVIATPDDLHVSMATAALEAGKHVYLLPPVAPEAAAARGLLAHARRADRVLYTGMGLAEGHRWARARAQLGTGGDPPRWIQAEIAPPPAAAPGHWSRDGGRSTGRVSGALFNVLYPLQHHLALGAPVSLTALGGHFHAGAGEPPDALTVTAHYAPGTTVVLTCAPDRAQGPPAVLRGPWGALELPDLPGADINLDLDVLARAITSGDHTSGSRLYDACTVQAALCDAVEDLARVTGAA